MALLQSLTMLRKRHGVLVQISRSSQTILGSNANVMFKASVSRQLSDKVASPEKPKGFLNSVYGPDSNVASTGFTNRWLMAVPALQLICALDHLTHGH